MVKLHRMVGKRAVSPVHLSLPMSLRDQVDVDNLTDIIALLVLSIILLSAFLLWEHHLGQQVSNNPSPKETSPQSRKFIDDLLTAPPLLKLELLARAKGRMAAMQALAFFVWAGFSGWIFYATVSLGPTARLNTFHSLTSSCSSSRFNPTHSNLWTNFALHLSYQTYKGLSPVSYRLTSCRCCSMNPHVRLCCPDTYDGTNASHDGHRDNSQRNWCVIQPYSATLLIVHTATPHSGARYSTRPRHSSSHHRLHYDRCRTSPLRSD